MIQDMDRDQRNLIVYDMVTGTKFVLRAAKPSIRDVWLDRSCDLIQRAKQSVSSEMAVRVRSSSEPAELVHTFSFSRKGTSRRDKEGSKGRIKRPSSSTGVHPPPQGEEMVSEGCAAFVGRFSLCI